MSVRPAPAPRLARGLSRRAARLLAGSRQHLHRLDAAARALPGALVIGAQKAATSALYHYLCQHPQVVPALCKEVHYFDRHWARGGRWYRSHFPHQRALESNRALALEATPYYLFHPLCAARIAETLPAARLLVVLRDPVDRAWSHYRMEVRLGREDRAFLAAIGDDERVREEESRLASGAVDASALHRNRSYLHRGRYALQLERYLSRFPRHQLLIVDYRRLVGDTATVLDEVFAFLGLARVRVAHGARHNASDGRPLPPALRAALDEVFAPWNRRLERLLDTTFGW